MMLKSLVQELLMLAPQFPYSILWTSLVNVQINYSYKPLMWYPFYLDRISSQKSDQFKLKILTKLFSNKWLNNLPLFDQDRHRKMGKFI